MSNRHELVYEKNGRNATYGRVPYPITEWKGIVYFVRTQFVNLDKHKKIVEDIADMLESDSYDHGSEWRLDREKLIQSNERFEEYITLIDFRIKDSY